jgi:hypothetical protein
MIKKLAVPFLTLAMATFGCSSSTTPTTGGGGAGGTSTGGAAGGASGGAAGGASGGAAGHASGGAAGGASGGAAGGAGGTAAGGIGGTVEVDGGVIKVYQNVVLDAAMDMVDSGTATGTATVTLNETTGLVSVSGTFSGLSGPATMAHIHGLETSPGVGNEGIIVTLVATNATSGTLTGSGTLTPADVTGMLDGLTYLNIHTALHTSGEIRGNIGP